MYDIVGVSLKLTKKILNFRLIFPSAINNYMFIKSLYVKQFFFFFKPINEIYCIIFIQKQLYICIVHIFKNISL